MKRLGLLFAIVAAVALLISSVWSQPTYVSSFDPIRRGAGNTTWGDPWNDQRSYQLAGDILEDATTPPLILAWITPATTETDLSGNSNDATYSNFVAADQDPKGMVRALDFYGGTNEYLSLDDADGFSWDDTGSEPWSLCAWIQVVNGSTTQTIIAKYDVQEPDREWLFYLDSSEALVCIFFDEADDKSCQNATDAGLSVGWHFICHTYDSTGGASAMSDANSVWYVDGLAVAEGQSNDADYTGMVGGNTGPTIGAYDTGSGVGLHFQGDMGVIWIEDVELSAAAVWQYYIKTRGYYNE